MKNCILAPNLFPGALSFLNLNQHYIRELSRAFELFLPNGIEKTICKDFFYTNT
jgi:hypothetical protein